MVVIGDETHAWLESLPAGSGIASLIVQLNQIPEAELKGMRTARERIDFMSGHLSGILEPITRKYRLGKEQVKTQAAIGQAIIQGQPGQLKELVEAGGDLAKSKLLTVLPNKIIPGAFAK